MPFPSFETISTAIKRKRLPALLAALDTQADEALVWQAHRLRDCLQVVSGTLDADPNQLAGQLLGRLEEQDGPAIARLLAEARAWAGAPWLRPLTPSLASQGIPLVRSISAGPQEDFGRLALSPDQRYVLATVHGRAELWDIEQGQKLAESSMPGLHNAPPAFTPDGRTAVALCGDGSLRVWQPWEGTAPAVYKVILHSINQDGMMALSPDGATVAVSCGEEGVLTLHETHSGEVVRMFAGHPDIADLAAHIQRWRNRNPDNPCSPPPQYSGMAFTPDGRSLVTATIARTVCVWDVASGQIARRWSTPAWLRSLKIMADGRTVLAGTWDGDLQVWDLETATLRASTKAHQNDLQHLAVSGDDSLIVTAGRDPLIKCWRLEGDRFSLTNVIGHGGIVNGLALADQTQRIIASFYNGPIKIWDIAPPKNAGAAAPASSVLRKAVLTTSWVASVEAEHPTVLRLGALDEPPAFLAEHAAPIKALACSADERWLAAGDESGAITLWDVGLRTLAAQFKDENEDEDEDEYPTIWDEDEDEDEDAAVWPVDKLFLNHDGTLTAALYDAPSVVLWPVNRPDDPAWVVLGGDYAKAAAFDGAGGILATMVDTYAIEVWDLSNHERLCNKPFYDDNFSMIALTPNGQRIVAGSDYGHLILWEWRNDHLERIDNTHADDIKVLAITPDGTRAVSVGADGAVVFWDLIGRKLIARFTVDCPLLSVAVGDDGREALAVDVFGRVHRLRLEAGPQP